MVRSCGDACLCGSRRVGDGAGGEAAGCGDGAVWSSRKFGDVGNSSRRNAKGLASVGGPGRSLLSWRDTWRPSALGSLYQHMWSWSGVCVETSQFRRARRLSHYDWTVHSAGRVNVGGDIHMVRLAMSATVRQCG